MNKKTKVLLITLSLIILMAIPVFANQGLTGNYKFPWRTGRQTNIEIIAKKTGESVEDLLRERESVSGCKDLLEKYNLNCEDIKEAKLEQQFKIIDEKVAAGDITEEEGKAIKERADQRKFLQDCNGPHHGKQGNGDDSHHRMRGDGSGFHNAERGNGNGFQCGNRECTETNECLRERNHKKCLNLKDN